MMQKNTDLTSEMAKPQNVKHFTLREPEEIYDLAFKISRAFPDPDQAITGIYELMMNAIEHGNLGIGFDVKSALLRYGKLPDEMKRRLALEENANKRVEVTLLEDEFEYRVTIKDAGAGFDWKKRMNDCGRFRHVSPHGRGMMITMNCGFDEIRYNDAGNEVTLITHKP